MLSFPIQKTKQMFRRMDTIEVLNYEMESFDQLLLKSLVMRMRMMMMVIWLTLMSLKSWMKTFEKWF